VGGDGVKPGNGRYAANEFAGAKILSCNQNLALYERAHAQGYDEVVLLNERRLVTECTSGNISPFTAIFCSSRRYAPRHPRVSGPRDPNSGVPDSGKSLGPFRLGIRR
jgi:hypothetical protein